MKQEWIKNFIKSIAAGIMISVGCIVYLRMQSPIIGSFLFSLGLLSIVMLKLNLFTGKCGYILDNKDWKALLTTWVGNLTGCAAAALAIGMTPSKVATFNLAWGKMYTHPVSLFILAILCGALMFTAVEGYKRTKQPLIVVLCVMVFILTGSEHCIADAFYGFAAGLDARYFFTLVLVTAGNLVGGVAMNFVTNTLDKPEEKN